MRTLPLVTLLVLATLPEGAIAQVRGGYLRHREDLRGDLTLAANTILTCETGTEADGVLCEDARMRSPVMRNNSYRMKWIDLDGNDETFNSSASTLVLPEGASVRWARLYWMCATGRGTEPPDRSKLDEVLLRAPGGDYQRIVADTLDQGISDQGHGDLYFAGADVTEPVSEGGAGLYWLANMQCAYGTSNLFGGWSMVVVYADDKAELRNVTVFDSYRKYNTQATTFEVSGFMTPVNGTVRSRVALVLGDGDAGSFDSLRITSGGRVTEVGSTNSGALNPQGDMANSTISSLGFTAPGRVPTYDGTFGFDADLVDTVDALPNGATSATLRAYTDREVVFTGVVAFATDMLAPDVRISKTWVDVNGELVRSGDVIEYVLAARNTGAAGAIDTLVRDVVPDLTTYVPGSITLDGRPLTDAAGDDEGEYDATTNTVLVRPAGGRLAINAGATIRFRVEIDHGLASGTLITNQAHTTFAHEVLGPTSSYETKSDGEARKPGDQPTLLWPIDERPPPELTVTKTVLTPSGTRQTLVGDEVTWVLEVSNPEFHVGAVDVVLADELDPVLQFLAVKTAAGPVALTGPSLRIPIGLVDGGAKTTVEIRTRIGRPDAPQQVKNQAKATAANAEERLSDDPDTELLDDPTVIDVGGFAGDGCGCGSTSNAGLFVLLGGLALLARRRPAVVLGLLFAGSTAQAQDAGFQLNRYDAGVLPKDGFLVKGTDTLGRQRVTAQLQFDYAHDPLVFETTLGDASTTQLSLVRHQLVAHAGVAVGITDTIVAWLHAPVNLVLSGETATYLPIADGLVAGDPSIGARWKFLEGAAQDDFDLGVQLVATAPLADTVTETVHFAGERGFTAAPTFLAQARVGDVRFDLNLGAKLKPASSLANLELSSELNGGFGFAWEVSEEFSTHAELGLATPFAHFFRREETPAEALFGVRWRPTPEWQIGAAAGPGLSRGVGAADVRGVLAVNWTPVPPPPEPEPEEVPPPPPSDLDGDGYVDELDRCPRDPEDFDKFADEDGCPDPDNDQDTVLDPADACPLVPGAADNKGCPWPDTDGDGWLDNVDRCPLVKGDPLNEGCPWPDTDGDGVLDNDDQCPLVPGPATNHGCPDPDRDGDTVPDRLDECPDEKGDPSNGGCPIRMMVVLRAEKIEIRDSIYFETDRDVIQRRSHRLLLRIAEVINEHPEVAQVRVEGHTDTVGSRRHNVDLSARRAKSVVKFLVKRGKVDPKRLVAEGFGPDRPVDSNRTADGRAQNRRVEFNIVEPASR